MPAFPVSVLGIPFELGVGGKGSSGPERWGGSDGGGGGGFSLPNTNGHVGLRFVFHFSLLLPLLRNVYY